MTDRNALADECREAFYGNEVRKNIALRKAHDALRQDKSDPSPRASSVIDQWQDIRTAPRDGTGILAKLPDSDMPIVIRWGDDGAGFDGWRVAWDGQFLEGEDSPAHWRPLGPLPAALSPAPAAAPTLGREADCDCGASTSGKWSGIHSKGCLAMRETTGVDDVEWLDAKVVELSKENERLRAALTAPDQSGPDDKPVSETAWRALRAHQMWSKRESEGPLYPFGMKRDDPGGEAIWHAWWNDQLRLCEEATRLTDEALAARSVAETKEPLTK